MGWRLVREAEDYAPADLTWRERYALLVLANAAVDSTRECPPGIEDRPEIVARLRLTRTARFEVISALRDKGALVQLKRGGNGRVAHYAVARLAPVAPVDTGELDQGNPDAKPGRNSRVGSGFDGALSPGNPDATRAGTIFFRGDSDETRSDRPYPQARAAIRRAFPDLSQREIDETIRVIKVKFSPQNTNKYIGRLIQNGDLAEYIPCGLGKGHLSDRCRHRDCANCSASWCEGRCHGTRVSSGGAEAS